VVREGKKFSITGKREAEKKLHPQNGTNKVAKRRRQSRERGPPPYLLAEGAQGISRGEKVVTGGRGDSGGGATISVRDCVWKKPKKVGRLKRGKESGNNEEPERGGQRKPSFTTISSGQGGGSLELNPLI